MEGWKRGRGESMREKVTGSDSTLDTFKVTQYDRTFPRVYYCKERQSGRENFKVQKLFADVQIRSKSL